MSDLVKQLGDLQKKLKAPKNQFNKFGNYKYRTAEDILEAVKPLIPAGCIIKLTDEIINLGDRYYIKASAIFSNGATNLVSNGWAREEENKKGMDGAQVTGAASSYARKYALNGLLLIDDTKDADFNNTHDKEEEQPKSKNVATITPIYGTDTKSPISEETFNKAIKAYKDASTEDNAKKVEEHLISNYLLSIEQKLKWNKLTLNK